MSDHFDDQIREALNAEAEGVTAHDDLLERISAAAARSQRTWVRRSAPWLLAAAAITVFAGVAGVLVDRDDEQTVDVVDDPNGTPTLDIEDIAPTPEEQCATHDGKVLLVFMSGTATDEDIARMAATIERARIDGATAIDSDSYVDEADVLEEIRQRRAGTDTEPDSAADGIPTYFVVTMPAGTDDVDLRGQLADLPGVSGLSSTDCDGGVGDPAPSTAIVAWVGADGVLSALDSGGQVMQLADMGDPRDDVTGGNPILDVSLAPDGAWVYFGSCCPENSRQGEIWRVRTDGSSAPERIATGYDPSVDPSGRFLAIADPVEGHLFVTTVEGDPLQQLDMAMGFRDPQWSPDSGRIVFSAEEPATSRVYVVDVDTETGFGEPRRLPGLGHMPVWTAADSVTGIDLPGICDDCAEPKPGDLVVVSLDGSEVSRASAQKPVLDLATSADGALAIVYSNGMVVVHGELPDALDDVPGGIAAIDL